MRRSFRPNYSHSDVVSIARNSVVSVSDLVHGDHKEIAKSLQPELASARAAEEESRIKERVKTPDKPVRRQLHSKGNITLEDDGRSLACACAVAWKL